MAINMPKPPMGEMTDMNRSDPPDTTREEFESVEEVDPRELEQIILKFPEAPARLSVLEVQTFLSALEFLYDQQVYETMDPDRSEVEPAVWRPRRTPRFASEVGLRVARMSYGSPMIVELLGFGPPLLEMLVILMQDLGRLGLPIGGVEVVRVKEEGKNVRLKIKEGDRTKRARAREEGRTERARAREEGRTERAQAREEGRTKRAQETLRTVYAIAEIIGNRNQ